MRTLGFYQPYGTLMLHGKLETRWISEGRKPPFPLDDYLLYSTQKCCDEDTLMDWAGEDISKTINMLVSPDTWTNSSGQSLAIGTLINIRKMTKEDEAKAFVKFIGSRIKFKKNGTPYIQHQWILEFVTVKAIEPFKWDFGKQGIGFVPESEMSKIKFIQ